MTKKSTTPTRHVGPSDNDFQPGSRKKVLRNKLAITSPKKIADEEIVAYQKAAEKLARTFAGDHQFTVKDLRKIHKEIFGKLYDWAGEYRNRDLSRTGFMFTRAIFIDERMKEFSERTLEKGTPPAMTTRYGITLFLAEVHNELILIHPFREGNGRAVRLLIHLIAQQAGYQGLDFGFIKESGKEYDRYIAAVQAAVKMDHESMRKIVDRALF